MPVERPIPMTDWSVQRILADAKTQTRRVMQQPYSYSLGYIMSNDKTHAIQCGADYPDGKEDERVPPLGIPGDRLWVREVYAVVSDGEKKGVCYRADGIDQIDQEREYWISWMFMPRKYSRILLEITDVRVERVQSISVEDCIAEGCVPFYTHKHCDDLDCPVHHAERVQYQKIWDKINGKKNPWSSNPWVFAYTFKRVQG